MMDKKQLSEKIKAEAISLGFSACGIAQAGPVEKEYRDYYCRWLSQSRHATMGYLENYQDKRFDPRLLHPGTKSIVCLALNYAPRVSIPEREPQLAAYALGKDYHDVMKAKLRQLVSNMNFKEDDVRVFCDTAPVLERYWAYRAGLGWIGRNHQLIIPHGGSMYFLGELFLPMELEYDQPLAPRCGKCHACIDACPTHALQCAGDGHDANLAEFDSRKCLSYLTIENRDDIPGEFASCMDNTIYGCDKCQKACPHNRFSVPNTTPELQPSVELLAMRRDDWLDLTVERYRSLFKGSAVKRAKYDGLMRNIIAALK